jgi:hypothetical protein
MPNNASILTGEQPAAVAGNNNSQTEYLTKVELARKLRRSTRTIDTWTRNGYLPVIKMARSVLFHWPTVQRHIAENFSIGG